MVGELSSIMTIISSLKEDRPKRVCLCALFTFTVVCWVTSEVYLSEG